MKISLVIHGPEVIDSREAKIILEKLSCLGEVKAELGGTMGKTAVLPELRLGSTRSFSLRSRGLIYGLC